MRTTPRVLTVGVLATASALALAACSSASEASTADLEIGSIDLSGVCPATIVVQTDFNPEAEHGFVYELVGEDPTIDTSRKSVTGPLTVDGEYTGVSIEVRAGGPAIGFQQVSTQMYTDPDIMLGLVPNDEQIQLSDTAPTTAVFASGEKSPMAIMWDPATYPDAATVQDIVAEGAVIRYFAGSSYMAYLISQGIVPEDQTDASYDGTPAAFVAAGGADAQGGFATAEPYIYENEIPAWGKPIDYQLINDLGLDNYGYPLVVRTDEVDENAACLAELIPAVQKAEVAYFADPAETNALILQLVDSYDTGWTYSQGVADYAVETMLSDGLVSNGDNDYLGEFDLDRVQQLIDQLGPVFVDGGATLKEGLVAEDIVTNEFIDTSIALR